MSNTSFAFDDIDPAVLADVARVVQELMMQQQPGSEDDQVQRLMFERDLPAQNLTKAHDQMRAPLESQHNSFTPAELASALDPERLHRNHQVQPCAAQDIPELGSAISAVVSESNVTTNQQDTVVSSLSVQPNDMSWSYVPHSTDNDFMYSSSAPQSYTDSVEMPDGSSSDSHAPGSPFAGQKSPGLENSSSPNAHPSTLDTLTNKDNVHHEPMPAGFNDAAVDYSHNQSAVVSQTSPAALAPSPMTLAAPVVSPILAPTRPPRKKALLIGINYFGDPNQLLGCINDTRDIFGFLSGHYGFLYQDSVMLTDDQIYEDKRPTGANIRHWMKWLVKDAEPQDSLFFHYAGHGGRIKDFSYNGKAEHLGDEADGYDEIIYPCDYLRSGIISDDEMYDLMVKELPVGVQLTALVDACHSGTMLDLPYVYNGNPMTELEDTTVRTKIGAMAAMSVPLGTEIEFDLPGSNNFNDSDDMDSDEPTQPHLQTMTTTTTTTMTVTTTTTVASPVMPNQQLQHKQQKHAGFLSPPPGQASTTSSVMARLTSPKAQTTGRRSMAGGAEDDTNQPKNDEDSADEVIVSGDSCDECVPRLTVTNSKEGRQQNGSTNSDQQVPSQGPCSLLTSSFVPTSPVLDDLDIMVLDAGRINADKRMELRAGETTNEAVLEPTSELTVVSSPKAHTDTESETAESRKGGALFRYTKGNVVMFSSCRDDQASADIRASVKDAAIIANHQKTMGHNSGLDPTRPVNDNPLGYNLPQPYTSPMARGAVSYAWIQCLTLKREQTYEELLIAMRHFMKERDLEQIPQLGSGMPMDMRAVFIL